MESTQAFTVEHLIETWNGFFATYQLTLADLKKPHMFMGALFHILNRLGIEENTILQPPTEDETNKHVMYYWDLIPMVNMTRVVNHLVSVMPQIGQISMTHILQPTVTSAHSILLLLFNLMLFNEERLKDIAPYEEELFSKSDEVKALQDKKNRLKELLNVQAEEKGKRVETIEKLNSDIKQFDEELNQEKEGHDKEKQELDAILNENKQTEILLEQKKAHRDGLIAEVEKKRALRVYDADDITAQAAQAARNVQEAEEKLESLRGTLMQKENCLKNLQIIKPYLDFANDLLHEIMKVSENMRDDDPDDLDLDTKDGELEVMNTEISELEAQLGELRAARVEVAEKRRENEARRQQERRVEKINLADAEERGKKNSEKADKAIQRVEEIKQLTFKYKQEKLQAMEEIARIKETYITGLKSFEDVLVNKTLEAKKRIEEKLRNRSL